MSDNPNPNGQLLAKQDWSDKTARKYKNERGQCSQTPSADVRQPLAVPAHLKVPMDLMHPNNRRHEHGNVNLILLYWDFLQSVVQCCNVCSSEDAN